MKKLLISMMTALSFSAFAASEFDAAVSTQDVVVVKESLDGKSRQVFAAKELGITNESTEAQKGAAVESLAQAGTEIVAQTRDSQKFVSEFDNVNTTDAWYYWSYGYRPYWNNCFYTYNSYVYRPAYNFIWGAYNYYFYSRFYRW